MCGCMPTLGADSRCSTQWLIRYGNICGPYVEFRISQRTLFRRSARGSPGNLFKTQSSLPQAKPTESQSLGMRPGNDIHSWLQSDKMKAICGEGRREKGN